VSVRKRKIYRRRAVAKRRAFRPLALKRRIAGDTSQIGEAPLLGTWGRETESLEEVKGEDSHGDSDLIIFIGNGQRVQIIWGVNYHLGQGQELT